jgi:hypothetical protein
MESLDLEGVSNCHIALIPETRIEVAANLWSLLELGQVVCKVGLIILWPREMPLSRGKPVRAVVVGTVRPGARYEVEGRYS